jgi:O-antigen/teichoic acid export membrane protein
MFPDATGPKANLLRSFYKRARSNDVFRHGLLVLVATTLLNLGGFLFHAVVSRNLGVTTYGSLYAIISLVQLASLPAGIFTTVISKSAAEFRALKDPAHLRTLILVVSEVFGVGTLLYAASGLVFGTAIGQFLRVPPWAVVLAGAMAGAIVLVFALRAIAQGVQDFRGFSISLVLEAGLKATLGGALTIAKLGLAGGLSGFAAGGVLSGAYIGWRLWAKYAKAARTELHIDGRRVFLTTIGATALTVATTILSYGDVIVVKHFFAPHEAGIYAAASLGGKIPLLLVAFAPMVLIPKAVDSHTRGKNSMAALGGTLLMVVALSLVACMGFLFGANVILHLLVGEAFSEAAPILPWYALAMSLLAITNVIASYSIALHRFAFGAPLVFIALVEIGAIYFYHPALHSVVNILVIGNALALAAVSIALSVQSVALRNRLRFS